MKVMMISLALKAILKGVEELMLQAIPTYTEYNAEMEKHHANLAKAG
jgi:hypothetical protein